MIENKNKFHKLQREKLLDCLPCDVFAKQIIIKKQQNYNEIKKNILRNSKMQN